MIKPDRATLLRELRDILLLLALGLLMTFIFGYTKSPKQFWVIGSFTALMWVFLWKGNAWLSSVISSQINWLAAPVRSFFSLAAGTIVYTVSIMLILIELYSWIFNANFGSSNTMIYSATIVTIIITLFMHGRSFLLSWKQSAIDAEKLKRESMAARYESLKNQVNPHFLFNSLNALTNLVYENQDMAAKFIKQLSEVYRYVLDTRDRELVSCNEEFQFLDSYIFLQKIRFNENLNVEIDKSGIQSSFPPLVLQMLIENAIKHNEISSANPLTVRIYQHDAWVVVENNLQKKVIHHDDSSGLGLSNIISRYEFLSGKKVTVNQENGKFKVELPILDPAIVNQQS